MSYRLYVGNYPSDFTKEDVQHIFKEFGSFTVESFNKKDKKCFSFCYCTDIDELVSLIKSKNDILVSGRRLKVRALEQTLQDYVDLLIKDTDYDVHSDDQSTGPLEVTPNKCDIKPNDNDSLGKKLGNYPTETLCTIKDTPPDGKSSIRQNHAMKNKKSVTFFDERFDRNELKSPPDSGQSTSFIPTEVTTNKCDIKQDGKNAVDKNLENSPAQSSVVDNAIVPSQVIKDQKSVKFFPENSEHGSLQSYDKGDEQIMKHKHCEKLYTKNVETQTLSDRYNAAQNSFSAPLKGMTNQIHKNSWSSSTESSFITSDDYSSTSGFRNAGQNLFSAPLKGMTNQKHKNSWSSSTESSFNTSDDYNSSTSGFSNHSNSTAPRSSRTKTSSSRQYPKNELTWISVTNFPFGTTISSIYDLFYDYSPHRVIMIHNKPTKCRDQKSEAHVCFGNEDIARHVILNFDNTMFNNRHIFLTYVNDYENGYVQNVDHNFSATGHSNHSDSKASRRHHTRTKSVHEYRKNELAWVSFTNFPFYTTRNSIYDLFSDFDPLEIVMIQNKPTKNRDQYTEAYVCFSNEDIVTDVILNFDNTMFNNRLVLVNPVNDMTINNELLGFNS